MGNQHLNNPLLSTNQLTQIGKQLIQVFENTYAGVKINFLNGKEDNIADPLCHQMYPLEVKQVDYKKGAFMACDMEGFVHIYQPLVTPLLGIANEIQAMGTTILDMTQYAQLVYLLQLYQKTYPDKNKLVQHFSNYLSLNHYFVAKLQYNELAILVTMASGHQPEFLAEKLKHSLCTIHAGIDSIKTKLKANMTLKTVIHNLSHNREWSIQN